MSLKERVYSILLVSASENLNRSLTELFPPQKYGPVSTVGDVSAAKRKLAEYDYDFVIVNSPLPDEDGMRFSVDAVGRKNTVVMLLVRAEQYPEFFDRAAEFGVFLLSKPLSRSSVTLALDWLSSARERLRQTEKRVLSFEEKMDEIMNSLHQVPMGDKLVELLKIMKGCIMHHVHPWAGMEQCGDWSGFIKKLEKFDIPSILSKYVRIS